MRVVDLFSGAGGMSHGLCMAGMDVILACDVDEAACKAHQLNHPDTVVVCGDVRDLEPVDCDLVCGGAPCQGFSTHGKKQEHDPRNSLVSVFADYVEETMPEIFLFENVTGFAKMYGGRYHKLLLERMESIGYVCRWTILDASQHGVPQKRKRFFMVGHRGGGGLSFPRPLSTWWSFDEATSDLPCISSGEVCTEYACDPVNRYQQDMRGDCQELTLHVAPKHSDEVLERLAYVPEGGSIHDCPEEIRPKCFPNAYARLNGREPAGTMTRSFGSASAGRFVHPHVDRALTPREAARLQSFPDDYQFYGTKSQIALQIGNSVPPLLAKAIGEELMK